jgi:hypothetical protein
MRPTLIIFSLASGAMLCVGSSPRLGPDRAEEMRASAAQAKAFLDVAGCSQHRDSYPPGGGTPDFSATLRRMNITTRFARVGDFYHLSTGWTDRGLAWLEARRIYWAILTLSCSGRPAAHWQPLVLPSLHHPQRTPPSPAWLVLFLVVFLFLAA